MTAPLRVAVVGGAFARNAIVPAFERHPRFAVATLVSSRDARAVADGCTRSDVDLVSVHGAPFQHRTVVDRAMDSGKHVVCDKPFGTHLDDALHMAARARQHAQAALTTFQFRHEPWRRVVRDLVAQGAFGARVTVDWVEHHGAWRTPPTGWQLRRSAGGGWLGAMGSHIVDTVRWWIGDAAVVAAHVHAADSHDAADVASTLTLRAPRGDEATVVARGTSSLTTGPRVVVSGHAAAAEYAAATGLTVHGPVDAPPHVPTRSFPELLDAWCTGVAAAVDDGTAASEVATFDDGLAWARIRAQALGMPTSAADPDGTERRVRA